MAANDALPERIQRIFDNADAQAVRWHELCSDVARGCKLCGEFVQTTKGKPISKEDIGMMMAYFAVFSVLQEELAEISVLYKTP